MKKLLLISLLAVVAMAANAQVQNKSFDNDTIAADTNTYESNYVVDKYSTSTVLFGFTKVDVADSLNVAKMQGSLDNSNWVDLTDATANLTSTTTDGTTILYITNPKFLYYRGYLSCATGDTVAVTNAGFIVKED